MRLPTPASRLTNPGPSRMLRPELPNVFAGCTTKSAALNHRFTLRWDAGRTPVPTRFGRASVAASPVFDGSKPTATVKGMPDCSAAMPDNCQPVRTDLASHDVPKRALPAGTRSYTQDAAGRCLTAFAVLARSVDRSRLFWARPAATGTARC